MISEHMRSSIYAIVVCMMVLSPASIATQPVGVRSLSAGETRQGKISGCQLKVETQEKGCAEHIYQIKLPADRYWRVEVEQQGIDLVLSVAPPGDGDAITVNTPIERSGVETALLYSDVEGNYKVQVSSDVHPKAKGRYTIRITELANRTPEEQRHIRAEKAMTEAARLFFKQADAVAAIPLYEKAVTLWRELGNPVGEAQAAYCAGILYRDLDDAEKARRSFVHAAQLFEQLNDRKTQAYVFNDLGLTLAQLGDSKQARHYLQQARELNRESNDPYLEAITLNNYGLMFHFGGDLARAKQYYEEALVLFRQLEELAEQANTIGNIAGIYYAWGDPDPAFEHFEQSLSLARILDDKEKELATLGNMATLHLATGNLKKALTLYVEILSISRATGNRREEVWTLSRISKTYYVLGEYERALAFATEALPLWRRFKDRKGEASTLIDLGGILVSLGKTTQALDALNAALSLNKSNEAAVGVADALMMIGRAHIARGDKAAAAQSLNEAFDIVKNVGDKRRQATALLLRGSVYVANGAPEKALATLSKALALHRSSHNQAGEAETLFQLAVAQRELGAIHAALGNAEAAVTIVESMRTNITNPALRSTFFSVKHDVYQLYIDTLMTLHRLEPARGYHRKALQASERARARTLIDLLSESGADIRQGLAPELRDRHSALLREINAKTESQQQLLRRDHSREEARRLQFELQSKLSELDNLETRIRTRHPGYASLAQPKALSAAQMQSLLDPDTVLLEYALGRQRSFLWVVTKDAVHSMQLPARKEIEAVARRLYEQTSRFDPQAWRSERKSRETLAQMLLQPAVAHLNKQRIVIVADGVLHYVPFGALLVPDADTKLSNNPRHVELLQNHEVLYLPSASALAALRAQRAQRKSATKQLAVLGDPVFELSDPRLSTIEKPASLANNHIPGVAATTRQATSQGLQRLDFSRREAVAIAELVPEQQRLLALDFDASRATALSADIGEYRIVHFATHGMLNSQNPELSGLTLSRYDSTGASQPGFLALHDVYNLELAADLVVLSGCQTGLGKEIRGAGLVGLTRGFMYAGAPRVVASLWQVSDMVTAELMRRFYRAMLQRGLEPAAALRDAQLSIKNDAEHRSWRAPYHWAGFILQGDWQ